MNLEPPNTLLVKDSGMVLFDEDYRAHIQRLMAMLERERRAVVELREELARVRMMPSWTTRL